MLVSRPCTVDFAVLTNRIVNHPKRKLVKLYAIEVPIDVHAHRRHILASGFTAEDPVRS